MLCELYIENVAVIEKAEISFGQGFNVLTGETGAGKTILINSINIILGGRVSRDIVRSGAEKALVSAVFSDVPQKAAELLSEMGFQIEDGESLILSRSISSNGNTSCRIMNRPATAAALRELAPALINVHGQQDNQELLVAENHLGFIDGYGELQPLIDEYRAVFDELEAKKAELERYSTDEGEKARRIDLLSYQIDEIENAGLSEDEEYELNAELESIRNAAKIMECLGDARDALEGDDMDSGGAVDLLDGAASDLEEIQEYLAGLPELSEKLRGLYYEIEDIAKEVSSRFLEFDVNPARIDDIERRLDEIYKLKRKYGGEIPRVLAYLEKARSELEDIELSEERLQELEKIIAGKQKQAEDLAKKLTERRLEKARLFVEAVCGELKFLDMPNVVFGFSHSMVKLRANGADSFQFVISTNPGEQPKPMSKIASGGELSRIMLSVKNVLADKDSVKTLIFDEIDTGVSGRVAQKIGRKLREVSKGRQIICITHLAQIASLADKHLLIRKNVRKEKTYTEVLPLGYEGRKRELARIMGGEEITKLMLENAAEMLKMAGVSR
ncbi:MAG: DNA repair protein RecN [Oscillospiraceae bacterium]|jgi:DNA repair protein RecN (Recombination protein N)|nr:DNA repair protein RecN [Oscillospiraceae bacterium]